MTPHEKALEAAWGYPPRPEYPEIELFEYKLRKYLTTLLDSPEMVENVNSIIKSHMWEQIGSYIKFKGDVTGASQAVIAAIKKEAGI